MPIRFHRTIKIAPGVKLNLSKSGVSTTVGSRGIHFTFNKRGIRRSIGIPGTGLSEVDYIKKSGGAPHHERTRFGYAQSHGCVNLSVGDAHWLFDWAHVGDWVYVHDPTGQTPTDPSLYQGGAY